MALLPAGVLIMATVLGHPGPVAGDDFRLDNKIFTADARQPDSQGSTIFHDGVVYDFLDHPAEAIIFDRPGGRFFLLDMNRRLVAELNTKEVADFCERLQHYAAAEPNPAISAFANPQFKERVDFAKTGSKLTLSSPWITYQVRLATPKSPIMVAQYREFSDWYARLNTVLNPGSRPPLARLMLNEAIARQRALPCEVELTLATVQNGVTTHSTNRSRHELVLQLTKADLERVAAAQHGLKTFKPVRFEEYRQIGK